MYDLQPAIASSPHFDSDCFLLPSLPAGIALPDRLGSLTAVILVLLRYLRDVPGYLLDHIAHFQLLQPALRNSIRAMDQSEEVAGDQAGAVAVATVVDGRYHPLLQAVRRQGAPQANGQRLLGHPAAAKPLDDGARFLHARLVSVGYQTRSGGRGERYVLASDPRQDVGKQTSRQISARVAVGGVCRCRGIVEGIREEGARRHAHHAAAALAVIVGQLAEAATGA